MNSRTPQANSQVTAELKQMLRETQRKLRAAQSNLTESEHSRERRLKIMRKTHQSAIMLKQALIQELQDIIAEKDEYISQIHVEARLKNGCTPPNSPSKTSQVAQSSPVTISTTTIIGSSFYFTMYLWGVRSYKSRSL